jgi:hypothetical protein
MYMYTFTACMYNMYYYVMRSVQAVGAYATDILASGMQAS